MIPPITDMSRTHVRAVCSHRRRGSLSRGLVRALASELLGMQVATDPRECVEQIIGALRQRARIDEGPGPGARSAELADAVGEVLEAGLDDVMVVDAPRVAGDPSAGEVVGR